MSINFFKKGKNTSDATATANDIVSPKTAYVNNEKITGSIIPEYETSGISINNKIINNTGMGIYDLNYDSKIALVGNRGSTSFYILPIINNNISLDDSRKINMSTFGTAYGYTFKDIKFDIAQIVDNKINIFGVGTTNIRDGNDNRIRRVIFAMNYDIVKNTYTYKTLLSDSSKVYNQRNNDAQYHTIHIIEQNIFMVRPDRMSYYSTDTNYVINMPRLILQFKNNTITQLKSFTRPISYTGATDAFVSKDLYIDWNSSVYWIYSLQNGYSFSLIKTGNNTIPAIVDSNKFLLGNILYDMNNLVLKDYSDILSTSTYKLYVEGYLYELNPTNKTIVIYKFDNTTLELEVVRKLNDVISSYTISSSSVISKAYSNNYYINYGNGNNAINVFADYLGDSEDFKSLTINNLKLNNTSASTAEPSHLLRNKSAYNSEGKIIGSMPNNGNLAYTPSTVSQSIPAGYTSGGTIAAVTSEIDPNIIAENIKAGVTILGITGTYTGETEATGTDTEGETTE